MIIKSQLTQAPIIGLAGIGAVVVTAVVAALALVHAPARSGLISSPVVRPAIARGAGGN